MRKIDKEDLLSSRPYLKDGKWCVYEQLYPEVRGYKVHKFDDVDEALKFMSDPIEK